MHNKTETLDSPERNFCYHKWQQCGKWQNVKVSNKFVSCCEFINNSMIVSTLIKGSNKGEFGVNYKQNWFCLKEKVIYNYIFLIKH